MPSKNTPAPAETQALVPAEPSDALEVVKDILAEIPQADEDPTARMAAFILAQPAEKWEELWAGLPSARDFVGIPLVVHDLRARESDFEGTLGLYLILDATDAATGEHVLVSCSSQMSMVQLLTLYRRRQLPAKVEFVQKDKPTKAGFRPIHLRYLGQYDAAAGDPGAVVAEQ
jgi:hypothetical protein